MLYPAWLYCLDVVTIHREGFKCLVYGVETGEVEILGSSRYIAEDIVAVSEVKRRIDRTCHGKQCLLYHQSVCIYEHTAILRIIHAVVANLLHVCYIYAIH